MNGYRTSALDAIASLMKQKAALSSHCRNKTENRAPNFAPRSQQNAISSATNQPFGERRDRHGKPYGERVPNSNQRSSRENLLSRDWQKTKDQSPSAFSSSSHAARRSPLALPNDPIQRPKPQTLRQSRTRVNRASPPLEWRPKEPEEVTSARREPEDTPRPRKPPLERNLDQESFPPRIQTEEEIMMDLREVSIQYCNVPDPIERAARYQRVLEGETQGQMAETAARLFASAMNQETFPQPQRSLYDEQPQAEPPVILEPHGDLREHSLIEESLPKKRRGRPSLKKRLASSPLLLQGTRSRKRKACHIQNSPKRRHTQDGQAESSRGTTPIQRGHITTQRNKAGLAS